MVFAEILGYISTIPWVGYLVLGVTVTVSVCYFILLIHKAFPSFNDPAVTPPNQNIHPILPTTAPSTHKHFNFIVQKEMLPSLQVLEIQATEGQILSSVTVKTAYKVAALRTHPDKTGRLDDSEFKTVNTAYTQILECIQQTLTGKMSAHIDVSVWGNLAEMNYRLDFIKSEQMQVSQEMKQLQDQLDRLVETQRNQDKKVLKQQEHQLKNQQIIDDLSARFKRLFHQNSPNELAPDHDGQHGEINAFRPK